MTRKISGRWPQSDMAPDPSEDGRRGRGRGGSQPAGRTCLRTGGGGGVGIRSRGNSSLDCETQASRDFICKAAASAPRTGFDAGKLGCTVLIAGVQVLATALILHLCRNEGERIVAAGAHTAGESVPSRHRVDQISCRSAASAA